MADLIRIKSTVGKDNILRWSFEDESLRDFEIELDPMPTSDMNIEDGDLWLVKKLNGGSRPKTNKKGVARLQLISKVRELATWQRIETIDGFWMEPNDLKAILAWLHAMTDVVLIGDQGTGKTTFGYRLTDALGWQTPCKVDMATLKKGTDLFGTNAAQNGSTTFIPSALVQYIDRSLVAHEAGLPDQFLVIIDEFNRVHAKVGQPLHGLFDDTRRVSLMTAIGTKQIQLPPNLHVLGTENVGSEFVGTFQSDAALKDRFAAIKMKAMPIDVEVAMLVAKEQILERQALEIINVARRLRTAAKMSQLDYAPSFRGCCRTAQLVASGFSIRHAIVYGLLGWYDGTLDSDGAPEPNTQLAKAHAALRAQGVAESIE